MKTYVKVVILCGGKGKRLGIVGKKKPKCLVKINKKPIIHYILNNLSKYRIEKILISGFYKFNLIKEYLKTSKFKNVLVNNDGDISIAKRIKNNFLDCKYLLVCYGDEIADINIDKLIRSHIASKKTFTITTYPMKLQFGLLTKNDSDLIFKEKPIIGNVNIGFMVFQKESIKHINKYEKIENFINYMAKNKLLNEYTHKTNRITVNTIEEIEIANKKIIDF